MSFEKSSSEFVALFFSYKNIGRLNDPQRADF